MLKLGFAAYLLKPTRQAQFLRTVTDALSKSTIPTSDPAKSNEPGPLRSGDDDDESAQPVVLLTEDNLVNQKVAERMLSKIGCVVDVATDGQEAVQAARTTTYDVIFMDCQMPTMDGFAATRAIRELEEEMGGRVPIVALTANAMKGDREKCLAAGMDDYLSKPVKRSDLEKMVQRWVRTRRPEPQT